MTGVEIVGAVFLLVSVAGLMLVRSLPENYHCRHCGRYMEFTNYRGVEAVSECPYCLSTDLEAVVVLTLFGGERRV